jgi:signal transduction histidine kinase
MLAFAATADGRVWGLGTNELHVVQPDDRVVLAARPGDDHLQGLVADGAEVWAFSDTTVFQGAWQGDGVAWRRVAEHPGIVVAHADGGQLTAVDGRGLVRITRDGGTTRLHQREDWARARGLLRGRDCHWLHTNETLWLVPFDGSPAQEVELLDRERSLPPPLQVVYEDRQGLVWTGNRTAIRRAMRRPGVDNRVFAKPLREQDTTALAEVDDTVWLGTSGGTLLRLGRDGWQRVPPPWSESASKGSTSVVAMAVARSGVLYVATRRAGVFRRTGEEWETWLEPEGNVRTLVPDADGGMWCVHQDMLERRDDESPSARLRIASGDRLTLISDAVPMADGSLLAGCFRNRLGLQSLSQDSTARPFAMEWEGESVLRVLPGPTADEAWVTTLTGLWHIDLAKRTRSRVLATHTNQWLRNFAPDGPTGFWMTSLTELQHVEVRSARLRRLGAEGGSHPLPFMQRTALGRRNGEYWFGTRGGYTRVSGPIEGVFGWQPLAVRVAIEVGGHRTAAVDHGALRAEALIDDGPIRLMPALLDRSPMPPPIWSVGLRGPSGLMHVGTEDGFDNLPPGSYEALLHLRHPWGGERDLVLGTIELHARRATWPWWAATATLLVALLVQGWRTVQRRTVRVRRRLHLEQALAAGWPRPKEILDIAHVAIAATETLVRDGRAEHASIWLKRVGDGERLPLADFGRPLPDAATRARRCLDEGPCLKGHVYWLVDRDQRSACVQIRGGALADVEILLHDIACVDAAAIDAIEQACAPVAAAIDKQIWLDHLEREFIDRTSTLEAEAHDLRTALTTLRLSAFTLSQAPPELPEGSLRADAQRIGRSCDHILAALETMLRQVTATQPANLVQMNPMQVLGTRLELHEVAAHAKGLRLDVAGSAGDATAWLDEFLFARVVDNVLGNAIKYSPPGAVIRIHCEVQPAEFLLHVDDEGPGFPAGQREAVFLAGAIARSRPTGGEAQTGLGLWIARQAMRAMHGGIWIADRDGKGSRVSLWLPRHRTP